MNPQIPHWLISTLCGLVLTYALVEALGWAGEPPPKADHSAYVKLHKGCCR